MLRAPWLTALFLALGGAFPAGAEGIKFGTDFEAGLATAKKDGKLVLIHFTQKNSPGCVMMIKNVFSDPEIAQTAAKKFVSLKASLEEEKGRKMFQTYGVNRTPTVLVLDPKGLELVQENNLELGAFAAFLETAMNLNGALEALSKTKKENPAALAANLKKVAAVESKRTKKVLLEHADNEDMPESARRVALDGLSKFKEAAGDIVPYLSNKNQSLRTIAFNALKTMGTSAVPALLDGLDGYSPEQRVACFTLAYPHTKKNPKITKDAAFWRTGKAEEREPAMKAWKEWWDKTGESGKN